MNKYYKLDSRKVTYGEYWNITRSINVIIPWTAKLLGIPMKFASGLPYFETVRDLEVSETEFSPRGRQRLQALMDKCLDLGFHSPRFFSYVSMKGDLRTSFIAMLHPSGATVRLMYSVALKVQPPKEKLLVVLLSELRDGTFFFTSSQRKQFLNAPNIVANRLVGASPERLVESHLKKLSELPMSNPPKPVTTPEMLDDVWDRYEKESREFGMQRGIYVWMTPEEVEREQAGLSEAKAMSVGGDKNLDVLLEINALRNKKAGWTSMIVLFLVSLLLFFVAGKSQWSWNYLLILVGVVFVHELGHYVAMRAFNYQNVRMFFIPFFGAAVSGRHYNVAGWKKVVVSLMGPLPGIVLGLVVGMAGLILHQTLLVKIAIVSLILNGSNLVPILPLDGGWVFHTLIFSRHYILDVVFRVIAALALIASGAVLSTKVLPYLGIAMLIGIPAAYRVARITDDLRKRELPPVADNEQEIPPETADVIITEVKSATTRPQSIKLVAQQTLQIFEALNARPPGWAATIGLLFVHLATIGVAVVFAFAFIFAQRSEFRDLLRNGATMPKHSLSTKSWPVWNEAAAPNGVVIVANFRRATAANACFEDCTNRIPATGSVRLFGESVLLSLSPGQDDLQKQWLTNFEARTKDVFVDSTNSHAAFSLLCIAPNTNAAAAIVQELSGYLETLPGEALMPPWASRHGRVPAVGSIDLARQTYLKMQAARRKIFNDPALTSLENKLGSAIKSADESAATDLRNQIQTTILDLEQRNFDSVRTGSEGPIDTNVADLFIKLNTAGILTNVESSTSIRRELAHDLGQFALVDGRMAPQDERIAAADGAVSRTGLVINIYDVSFYDIAEGPVALASWLADKHCIGFRYNFEPGVASLDNGTDE